jgi:hypothetical protein
MLGITIAPTLPRPRRSGDWRSPRHDFTLGRYGVQDGTSSMHCRNIVRTEPSRAVGQAGGDGVIHHSDDGNGVCCLLERFGHVPSDRHEQVGRLTHSVLRKFAQTVTRNPLPECRSRARLLPSTLAEALQFGEECSDRTASCLRQHETGIAGVRSQCDGVWCPVARMQQAAAPPHQRAQ